MVYYILAAVAFLYFVRPDDLWKFVGGFGVLAIAVIVVTGVAYFLWTLIFPARKPLSPEEAAEAGKLAAGIEAEDFVRTCMDNALKETPDGGIALHNNLFVFNAGADNEYSAEIDHIFIGQFKVYVVETKYKSGHITAFADTPEWEVEHNGRSSKMRNALLQAKNSVKVLSKEIGVPAPIIPMVAIFGENTVLHGNPSNVVIAGDLIHRIAEFETHALNEGQPTIDMLQIAALLDAHSTSDASAYKRHIERANAKDKQRRLASVAADASVD